MGGRLGREMQPAVDQEEMSEHWGCCAFSTPRYRFIRWRLCCFTVAGWSPHTGRPDAQTTLRFSSLFVGGYWSTEINNENYYCLQL